MDLINIGSSSSGNCFVIEEGKERVILDLGFSYEKFQKRYRQQTKRFISGLTSSFCLVTHRHQDHAKGVQSFMENAAKIFVSPTMATEDELTAAEPGKMFNVGSVKVMPFEVKHKDFAKNIKSFETRNRWERFVKVECLGYVLIFEKTENVWLYMTDTSLIFPDLSNINYAIIECNHDLELIQDDCEVHIQRGIESHLSVQDVILILSNTNTNKLRKLYLSHNSVNNLDKEKAKKMIQEVFKGEILFCGKNGGFS